MSSPNPTAPPSITMPKQTNSWNFAGDFDGLNGAGDRLTVTSSAPGSFGIEVRFSDGGPEFTSQTWSESIACLNGNDWQVANATVSDTFLLIDVTRKAPGKDQGAQIKRDLRLFNPRSELRAILEYVESSRPPATPDAAEGTTTSRWTKISLPPAATISRVLPDAVKQCQSTTTPTSPRP